MANSNMANSNIVKSNIANKALRTVIIGFGRIAQGYAADPHRMQSMRYSTHAQVLAEHPHFLWDAVVDPDEMAQKAAKEKWGVKYVVSSPEELPNCQDIEVAVLATPPNSRLACLKSLPNLKAVFVEKPLGPNLATSIEFEQYCRERNLIVQVNLTRRADALTRSLVAGRLHEIIGNVQVVNGIYGNGLHNNGTHMVDLIRLFWGEVESVQAIPYAVSFMESPLNDDINIPFILHLNSGLTVVMQPITFSHYRENGLDIWGEQGRLEYMHGGMTIFHYPLGESSVITTTKELMFHTPSTETNTLGTALYEMYDNLWQAIVGQASLLSPINSALESTRIIEAIVHSYNDDGALVKMKDFDQRSLYTETVSRTIAW